VHCQLCACVVTTHAGCIFHYDQDFPEGSGKGFKESDKPNFTGSYYSYTKVPLATSNLRCPGSSVYSGAACMQHACVLL
jgi:hypothetical protein